MTQIEQVRRHLEAGKSITPMQAIAVYGIFRLASVIEDLRQRGLHIDCVLRWDEMGKRYGEYRIRKPLQINSLAQVVPGHGVGLPGWVRSLKAAKVVGHEPDAKGGAGAWLVRFIRGQNLQDVWLNDKELVRVD